MLKSIDEHFRFLETALKGRAYRQELLGSNLANADTPNYKAVDFDFKTALTQALGKSATGGVLPLTKTAAGHLGDSQSNPLDVQTQYRVPYQASIDGNTVESENEMARFSENAMQYQALLSFTTNRIKTLQQALSAQ
ncbi:flagellar basal body rod protein FlgB [Leeia oryzae]|uniref:flagellar basal body rod protein FlgB n=1 Tax=Leeia oryzae TaxID=356662 RepID=UPI000364A220|nr:flagellar basal body rod protein FlgB [Leeia oryzae]